MIHRVQQHNSRRHQGTPSVDHWSASPLRRPQTKIYQTWMSSIDEFDDISLTSNCLNYQNDWWIQLAAYRSNRIIFKDRFKGSFCVFKIVTNVTLKSVFHNGDHFQSSFTLYFTWNIFHLETFTLKDFVKIQVWTNFKVTTLWCFSNNVKFVKCSISLCISKKCANKTIVKTKGSKK